MTHPPSTKPASVHPVSGCDTRVRDLLVCPVCRSELIDRSEGLACNTCSLVYPVMNGVPWMLPERARAMSVG
jgi:uncharacterized protein